MDTEEVVNRGVWHFFYTYHNQARAQTLQNSNEEVSLPLEATDEEAALEEARAHWRRLAKSNRPIDESDPTRLVYSNPRVVYIIHIP